jgi:hypothetical protein
VLGIVEAQPYLPIAPVIAPDIPELSWDKMAMVENTDFASLGFPAHLTENVLTMSGLYMQDNKQGFTKAKWDELSLTSKLTDFVKRSRTPPFKDGALQSLQARLRFYQIAPAFPSTKDHNRRNFEQQINGEVVKIHIPTVMDIAGRKEYELEKEDIKRWLKHEKGMTNNWWLKWTGFKQYASDMARDVLRWGDGSIPGLKANGRIQGHKAEDGDEWTDVAPRLALFVKLNSDGDVAGDGQLDFSVVHPYLTPRDESQFELFADGAPPLVPPRSGSRSGSVGSVSQSQGRSRLPSVSSVTDSQSDTRPSMSTVDQSVSSQSFNKAESLPNLASLVKGSSSQKGKRHAQSLNI